MSQIAYYREEVEIDARRAMTPARKRRIHAAWGGKCWFCRMPVPVEGPEVVYDHVEQLWLKGSDADEDIGPIHAVPCNKIKTAADATKRAKTKGQRRLRLDVEREPSRNPIPQRKNPWPPKGSRGFQSRPFPKGRGHG